MKWGFIIILIFLLISGCSQNNEYLNFEFNLEKDLVMNIQPYSIESNDLEKIRVLSFENDVAVIESKPSNGFEKFKRERINLNTNEEEIVTSTAMMWLSKDSFIWLKYEGKTKWDIEFKGSNVFIDALGNAVETSSPLGLLVLENKGYITYPMKVYSGVNNMTVNMKAISAKDTFSNEYVILDNKHNALVLEFKPNLVTGRALNLFGIPGFKIAEGYKLESVELP